MKFRIWMAMIVFVLAGIPVMAQDDDMDDMPESRMLYLICDWGLLTVEESTVPGPIFIDIDSPADYSAVESTFTVSGTGAGLFEGNVIVEASVQGEAPFFEGTTVLQAEELGAVGDWSIDIDASELEPATPVFVAVYSTSPEDGSTVAFDTLRLNANAEFGLRYVDITTPEFSAGVSTSPLLIEGMAGGAFENNIVIEVLDFESGDVLAETFATIETDEIGGSGAFSAEVMVDADPGTELEIYAYQPAIADDDEIEASDVQFIIASPLSIIYERYLLIDRDDPIYGAEDVCAVAEAEFENETINPLVINDVQILSTMSMLPAVNLSIEAAGSSNCPAPLRARTVRDGDTFNIEVYYDVTEPVPCTADLGPIPVRLSLGTLPDPDYTIIINGEPVE